jgi:hypothetical protein
MGSNAGVFTAAVIAVSFAAPAMSEPAPRPAAAVERAYTPLHLDHCEHTKGRGAEDYGSWRCPGYDGIQVRVSAGDQRTYISFGPNAAREIAARETLASFNSEGRIIEWRIARDARGMLRPFATIVRWNTTVTGNDDKPVRGQVLVVTRLGPGGVCHVGYVDGRANPNANDLAIRLADDRARNFRCGRDRPQVVGLTGPGFSGPYGAQR